MNDYFQHQASSPCDAHNETHFDAFHASALSGYPRYATALNSTSKRVRVNARVNNHPAHDVTIDTASDVSCISVKFVQTHPTLNDTEILAPPGAINLSSADGSLQILGYVTLPVEALALSPLGPDIMLLDNTIMGAFGAVLDWSTEQLAFKNSQVKLKASRRKVTAPPENPATTQCSVDTVDPRVEPVPVFFDKQM